MYTTPTSAVYATGYTTPSYPPTTIVSSSSSIPITIPKPKVPKANVFSNDGSFLERIHKLKRDELEMKKQEELLQCKRNFNDRFRNRGKRPPPITMIPSSSSVTSSDEDGPRPSKRSRSESSERSA